MEADPTAALHGRELTADERVLLRADPPGAVLRWCADAVGANARIVSVTPLMGGTSSAVHALDAVDAAGTAHALVLRRIVRPRMLAEEPEILEREAAALETLRGCPLPTPELVAVDADGTAVGDAPALLMTRLPGKLVWAPPADELEGYLRALAEVLPALHATPLRDGSALPDYEDYGLEIDRPPIWTRRPEIWERGFAVFDQPRPDAERRLIHRDYHPGNVLFGDGGEVSAIVDWPSTSVGSPDVDVGHCRMNLAMTISLDAADRFLALHREVTGRGEYDPYWDVVATLGGFDEDDVAGWTPRQEEFLARAVARL